MKGDIFHILNRGVEKRTVFLKESDYLRFVYNFYDFNDVKNVRFPYNQRRYKTRLNEDWPKGEKEELVDILSWVLLPNHPHILVQEKIDGGASIFSKKIFGGYTKYFNEANKRIGVLFQGRSKIIKVTEESHLVHLPFYIMTNPLDLIEPEWREKGIQDFKRIIGFLEGYKYSSFHELTGKENFPFAINKELFYKLFRTNKEIFKKDFIRWIEGRNYKKINFRQFE